MNEAADSIRTYLDRTRHLLQRVATHPDPKAMLSLRLAPDMFDTGFHFAVAIQFAARALCPPAGIEVPEIPEDADVEALLNFSQEIATLIAPIQGAALTKDVHHQAGDAELTQAPAPYVLRFAFPNMIFHLSLAYAGLRQSGMKIGKADFDGLHIY